MKRENNFFSQTWQLNEKVCTFLSHTKFNFRFSFSTVSTRHFPQIYQLGRSGFFRSSGNFCISVWRWKHPGTLWKFFHPAAFQTCIFDHSAFLYLEKFYLQPRPQLSARRRLRNRKWFLLINSRQLPVSLSTYFSFESAAPIQFVHIVHYILDK